MKCGQLISYLDGRRTITATIQAVNGDTIIVRPMGRSYVVELDRELDEIEILL